MEHEQDFSVEALDRFLAAAAQNGTMKFHTARTRRTALTRIARHLEAEERDDLRTVNPAQLAERIREGEPDLSEGTIQTYVTRLDRSLRAYEAHVLGKRVPAHEPPPAPGRSPWEMRDTLAIPLPRGAVIRISGVPRDLTGEEAELICAALRAYAESENL